MKKYTLRYLLLFLLTSFVTDLFSQTNNSDSIRGKSELIDPAGSRYFYTHSMIPQSKGKGHYQNLMILGNFVDYTITKNISLKGGFELSTLIEGEPTWFIHPKIGLKVKEGLHAGGGVLIIASDLQSPLSLRYAGVTKGRANRNLTVGVGTASMDGEQLETSMILMSGIYSISKKCALLTENYFAPFSSDPRYFFGMHGIRIVSKKHAVDLGILVVALGPPLVGGLPFASYTRSF